MKLIFDLPNFDGFYHSFIDLADIIEVSDDIENYGDCTPAEYDKINWQKTEIAISQRYLDYWVRKNESVLNDLGLQITFDKVDSPKEYNFTTDKCVCVAKFNKREFLSKMRKHIRENADLFSELIKDNHSSRSGFVSFYSDNLQHWLTQYLTANFDNVIFQTCLQFITEELTTDEKWEGVLENYMDLVEYNN